MKYLFIFFFALTAQAGQETRNGAGAAEQNFYYALNILKPLYKICLSSPKCLEESGQKGILKLIYENMDQELKNTQLLSFGSAAKNPELYTIDGEIKIAQTGLNIGSKIYINSDMIYTRTTGTLPIPYSVGQAISVLTHELAHHVPIMGQHEYLDNLGARLRVFYESNNQTIIKDNFLNTYTAADVSLSVFHESDQQSFLWLNVDDVVYDINEELKNKLKCRDGFALKSYRIGRLTWDDEEWGQRRSDEVIYPLDAQVVLSCAYNAERISTRYRIRILFHFIQPYWGKLSYQSGQIILEQKEF
jgi:hypothetical protein